MYTSGCETVVLPLLRNGQTGENRNIAQPTPSTEPPHLEATASRSETVALSSQGRDIQRIQHLLQQTPDIREHRVVEATSAVEQGTLTLTGSDLADSILADPLHTTLSTS